MYMCLYIYIYIYAYMHIHVSFFTISQVLHISSILYCEYIGDEITHKTHALYAHFHNTYTICNIHICIYIYIFFSLPVLSIFYYILHVLTVKTFIYTKEHIGLQVFYNPYFKYFTNDVYIYICIKCRCLNYPSCIYVYIYIYI